VDPHHQYQGGSLTRSVQRYTQRASGFVDNSLGDANVTVRDKVLKHVASNVGPSLVKYKHGRHLIVTSQRTSSCYNKPE
jgi:hypothetical protein